MRSTHEQLVLIEACLTTDGSRTGARFPSIYDGTAQYRQCKTIDHMEYHASRGSSMLEKIKGHREEGDGGTCRANQTSNMSRAQRTMIQEL